jgi:predicted DNA-binding antitoxin AbrB/MazE fold protein
MTNLFLMTKKDSLKPGEEVDLKSKERKEHCIKKRRKKSKSDNTSNLER